MPKISDARWRLRTPEERKAYEAAQRMREAIGQYNEAFEEYKNQEED